MHKIKPFFLALTNVLYYHVNCDKTIPRRRGRGGWRTLSKEEYNNALQVTDIKASIAEILEAKKDDGGVKNLYFVGCGGSLGALYPAKELIERESAALKTGWVNSNEFVHSTPKDFGKNSIICLACHKGNTPETIAAARLGKEMGAAVIILTWLEESEIIEFGDLHHPLFLRRQPPDHLAGDIDYAGEKTMCALQVAVELLNQTEGYAHYDAFQQGAGMITGIIRKARAHVAARALAFAQEYKDDSVIYTMGSGTGWGAAYMESICIFMEMQWMHSACIHTGEFFHGPFEVTDANTPFVIQISEGTTRALGRALPEVPAHLCQADRGCWTPRSWACPPSTHRSWITSTTRCSTTSTPSTTTPWPKPVSIR